jgi:hypothetical protein
MNEPKRLLDDPSTSDSVRELLAHAPELPPLDAAVRAQMGDAVVHLAASVKLGGSVLAKWIAIAMTSAAVVTGGAAVVAVVDRAPVESTIETPTAPAGPPSAEHAEPVLMAAPEPARAEAVEAIPSEQESEIEDPASAREPPRERAVVRADALDAPGTAAVATPEPAESVAAEARYLEDARRILASDPSLALARANGYRAAFPRAQLASESDFIAIDALARLGRTEEARARARALLARHPTSFYADRVRALVGEASP